MRGGRVCAEPVHRFNKDSAWKSFNWLGFTLKKFSVVSFDDLVIIPIAMLQWMIMMERALFV